ncbi:MAG: DNA topoisomerase IV subunit A [Bacilli bacterium]|nr:DNA topoisomerase IV subunit A [Bacilli bacterium]
MARKKEEESTIVQKIHDYALEEIMGDRFASYAKEIIQDRALPDVRDGLKPVQRRILYGMYESKNTYDKKYRKSAKAVGEIMGNYHPHGDSSIYDAMVRMSQYWKMTTPYIDMHGNNGSMDGDSAAAMRYTEARLSKISNELLKDIEKNTVNMAPNYDDTRLEPTVLPCKFPNLLVNGSTGISAGYATNIPPHNLGEVIDATIKKIDKPNCSFEEIFDIVKGPDFPTGGVIEGKKQIEEAYRTGKGKINIKCKYEIVKEKGNHQIIISEIPFEVNKQNLVKKINDIRIEKKIDGIVDARDETARGDLRIAIDLKKDANSELILNYLLKNTDMQISYSFNMIAIVNRRPKLVGILEILDAYIAHQIEVITRRSKFDLEHAKVRMHIVDGYLKAMSILDEVIKCIRKSNNRLDAINNLVKEFEFTSEQATAIVDMKLYRLTNTDVVALEEEKANLEKIIAFLNSILSDDKILFRQMKKELLEIKKEYSSDRKTQIKDEVTEIKIDTSAMIPKEDVIVVVTKEGYVKRVSKKSYASSNIEDINLKENDYVIGLYEMNTLDTVLLFTDLGNYLYVPVHELPDLKWKDLGKHISNIISVKSEENIIASIPVFDFNNNQIITIFTKNSMVKRTLISDFKVSRYSKEITCIKLKDDDKVVSVTNSSDKEVLTITSDGYALWYSVSEVPISGIKSSGVKSIKLKNDYVIGGYLFNQGNEYVTIFTDKMTSKRVRISDLEKSSRSRRGLLIIREVKTNPHKIIKAFVTNSKEILGLVNSSGINIIKNSEITINDRHSTGSNISKSKIKDVFLIQHLKSKKELEEEIEVLDEVQKKDISLKEIDDKIMTIDDFLDDFEV